MQTDSGHTPFPLRASTLGQIADTISTPTYDRTRILPGLVHIGVGGFNRSHLAVYLDDLLTLGQSNRWGELGVGLLAGDKLTHSALMEQDFLYGLLEMDSDHQRYRVIGSLTGHLYAPELSETVLARLASGDTAIISLTVTEGGYFIEDASSGFLADHDDIRHDLEHPDHPRTWLGYVAEAANRRMRLGSAPFTLLSCDNLRGNGTTARTALLAFGEMRGTELRRWMEANISFPNSMVDRITPRTTEDHRSGIASRYGVIDRCPVVSEPFRQWVLEDEFAAGRPAWEMVGAQMTSDVAPYEKTKMRLLNGGHSAIGYAADLLGYGTIAEAATDADLHALLVKFMAEVRPTLDDLPGIDLDDYAATIVKRFSNTAIRDQVGRICSDGCTKMAKFIVPTLVDLLNRRESPCALLFVLASWLHYLRGSDENGRTLSICDPSLGYLQTFIDAGSSDARLAFSVRPIFGEVAFTHPQLVSEVQMYLDELHTNGVRATIKHLLSKAQSR